MNIVYSNDKMIVEVDGVDTVFVTSKATNGMMSVQVNDDDGFNVVYSEDEQSLMLTLAAALKQLRYPQP